MKPMLAAKADLDKLKYPVLGSPKLDGIRCLIVNGEPVSRRLKPIPNEYIGRVLRGLGPLDGELIVGDPTAPDCFGKSTSGVMSKDGEPNFKYHVFDHMADVDAPFSRRLTRVGQIRNKHLVPVPHKLLSSPRELLAFEAKMVNAGFEGIMIRDPGGRYKFGRSTVREGLLLKVKRFDDDEAIIVDIEELMHNNNAPTKNALGQTERSSAKAGKVQGGTMGALVLWSAKFEDQFRVGTGFTAEMRADIWRRRDKLIGRVVKFRHQPSGAKDKPRFPSFIGFRLD